MFGVDEQVGLWEPSCASTCIAYAECGGSPYAPCGCVFAGSDRQGLCHECHVSCRERSGPTGNESAAFYRDGLSLGELSLVGKAVSMPPFVPLRTSELSHTISAAFVAAGFRDLFRRTDGESIRVSPHLDSAASLRRRLRVRENARVLVVLNGHDDKLESFWGSDRPALYETLRRASVSLVTGPTFSISGESGALPPYHNATMDRRQNRVLQELNDAGMTAVPNIYWRNDAARRNWADHIRSSSVSIISRDFSRTKAVTAFDEHINGLAHLVESVGRPLHVIVLGVGIRKATYAMSQLRKAGATSSFVASEPIMQAIKRGAALEHNERRLTAVRRIDVSTAALALANLNAFQEHLLRQVDGSVRAEPPIRYIGGRISNVA